MLNYAVIHSHSEHSIKDSAMSVSKYVKTASEMGYEALALTDLGSMTGIIEFIKECKENKVKAIPGIEATFNDKLSSLILLAKNYKGFIEINNAFKKANENIYIEPDSLIRYPLFSMDILNDCLDSENVAVIIPCNHGIISDYLLRNNVIDKKIEALKELQKKYPSPNDKSYILNTEKLKKIEEQINVLSERKKKISAIKEKDFVKKLCALEAIKDIEPETYHKKKKSLDIELLNAKKEKSELPLIEEKLKNLKEQKKILKLKLTSVKKKHKDFNKIQKEIDELSEEYLSNNEVSEQIDSVITQLKDKFSNSLYFELCNHNNADEKIIINEYIRLSKIHNIRMLISNDVKYALESDYISYQLNISLKNKEWISDETLIKNRHIRSYDEIAYSLKGRISDVDLLVAFRNTNELVSSISFEYPDCYLDKNKHYPKYISEDGYKNAEQTLRERVKKGILNRGFTQDTFTKNYIDRMRMELETIIEMGFADYLLIVQDYILYGKTLQKYGVGPGRGSAAGSLVCYLLEITNIDPIKYNLKFERFLNPYRVTMPDIDTDFSSEIRYKVADYVADKYGRDTVAFIRTKSTQQGRNSIRNMARVLGYRDNNDYSKSADKIAKDIPFNFKGSLNDYKETLFSNYTKKIEKEIITKAIENEGSMTAIGTHAAGVIIGDGRPLTEYVPVFYNPKMEEWSVSCDKEEAEEIGLLKMDFLGLNNLDVICETVERVKKYRNIDLDMDNIPFESEVFENIFSTGSTVSIFQFESKGMRDMLKTFKPTCFEDIILLVSAYRPGPMEFIPDIIKSKNGELKPEYCVLELEEILSPTYGYPIYQEQLMDIFSKCAGFSQGEADIIRRYMSKKKVDKFKKYKNQFINGLIEHGAVNEKAEELWDSLVSFSEYAFNKSHATAYAFVSYQTAYLKYHYPEYYMCAVLNNINPKKLSSTLYECREMGIKIYLPDINKAYENFENTGDGIIFGFSRIKNVKNKILPLIEEKKENGAFISFKDFVRRTRISNKLVFPLIEAGCFDGYRSGMRTSYKIAYSDIMAILDNISKSESNIAKLEEKINNAKKPKKSMIDDLEAEKNRLADFEKEYSLYSPSVDITDNEDCLERERELLGAYVSGHPLDAYKNHYKTGKVTMIADILSVKDNDNDSDDEDEQNSYNISNTNVTCLGIIKDVFITHRKTDNKEMAFFNLEDYTGTIGINCFTKKYEQFSKYIKEGNVVEINGIIFDDEAVKITVNSISKIRPIKNPLYVSIPQKSDLDSLIDIMNGYVNEEGHPVLLHYQDSGNLEYINMTISKAFMYNAPDFCYVNELYNY